MPRGCDLLSPVEEPHAIGGRGGGSVRVSLCGMRTDVPRGLGLGLRSRVACRGRGRGSVDGEVVRACAGFRARRGDVLGDFAWSAG